jgi:uracil-DNA glycosylase
MTIQEYFGDWSNVVDLKEADRIIKELSASNCVICPQLKDIFRAFRLCSYHNLRVVIIGKDPYPDLYNNRPRATGLAFANTANTPEKSYSPSLEILRESVIDFTKPHRIVTFDASLEKWASQGVLLLNSALTCQVGRVGSHTLLWRPFITTFLTNLSKCSSGIVYVLMGNQAQTMEPYINPDHNYVIRIRHPSYYARTKTRMPSDIWQEINNILISQNGYGIEWYTEY